MVKDILDKLKKIDEGIPKVMDSIETGSDENLRHQVKNIMAIEHRIVKTLIFMLMEYYSEDDYDGDSANFFDNEELNKFKNMFGMK